ncbi:uncharacterized protein NFIA_062610 [Aspergillus fischeri NRRL 181]|uniref:Uncharacterized protein n=1 Tax=Neosartorya fischeri (strain ATCC 1020 / DSM 3700 / CBS 544.65 / FGSC A1164 / JCM 1740 / NRRL 181 / WB 181) TaxID=331117 RepID=A1D5V6_NEOFI|nr:uncharacterized protein NFIA_062610 [Aspergillus fischeri NRRL 181]EAW21100.1 hypothetical protein NFIA_062610 [Aspergillus fischeri NRRL 181]KAG2019285.1 hypothetical protein GB937_005199 [Aspergillus fischeri]
MKLSIDTLLVAAASVVLGGTLVPVTDNPEECGSLVVMYDPDALRGSHCGRRPQMRRPPLGRHRPTEGASLAPWDAALELAQSGAPGLEARAKTLTTLMRLMGALAGSAGWPVATQAE